MSYAALFAALEPLVDSAGAALWVRHMTLGPAPEFCLRAPHPVPLPAPLAATTVQCRTVWPD